MSVLFGGNGMRPDDLVDTARHSAGLRLSLWAGWLLLAAPATRALLSGDQLDYLRWLPISRRSFWLILGVLLLAIESPWALLWGLGGGIGVMLSVWIPTAAVHACISVPIRGWPDAVMSASWLALLILAMAVGGSAWVPLCVGAAGLAWAMPLAWARGPDRVGWTGTRRLVQHPVIALAQCYVRSLLRARCGALWRALVLIALGAAFAALFAHANRFASAEFITVATVIAAVSMALATGGLAAPVVETERGLRWVMASSGLGHDARTGARVLAMGWLGFSLGTLYAVVVAFAAGLTGWPAGQLAGSSVLMGVAMALFAGRVTSWAERADSAAKSGRAGRAGRADELDETDGIDGNRIVIAMLGAVVVAVVTIAVLDELSAPALAALALSLSWQRG